MGKYEAVRHLNQMAMQALSAGHWSEAATLLDQALTMAPHDQAILLNRAATYRVSGNLVGAMAVLEQILINEPRSFMALLMKASLVEAMGDSRHAAVGYGIAASLAPPDDQIDPGTRRALNRGRALHAAYLQELRDFLADEISRDGVTGLSHESRRINAFIDQVSGKRKCYLQQPTHFHYPGMPSIEFYDREEFPWLSDLEASTGVVQEELQAVLNNADLNDNFEPYINYSDTEPLDQWRELNRSLRWSGFHFYNYGRRFEENCKQCPRTLEILHALPQPRIPGKSPAAMFSVLKPHTHIPPHTGVANTRLVVHLPLIVPNDCTFRVGNETRPWQEGKAWVFDDTIDHEARNDSDFIRIILLFDIWQPRLGPAEREAITHIMTALDRFNGETVGMDL